MTRQGLERLIASTERMIIGLKKLERAGTATTRDLKSLAWFRMSAALYRRRLADGHYHSGGPTNGETYYESNDPI